MRALKVVAPRAERLCATAEFEAVLKAAAENADDVDRQGRFPKEAIAALKGIGALGWLAPGGGNARLEDLAEATFALSRRCSATGMIFAMHQIQVASLVRHGGDSQWMVDYLRRMVEEQRLIASATSEVGVGGNMRKSVASLEHNGDLISFQKKASTISYGGHADDLLTTLRRNP